MASLPVEILDLNIGSMERGEMRRNLATVISYQAFKRRMKPRTPDRKYPLPSS
jgi:hypothetical protein